MRIQKIFLFLYGIVVLSSLSSAFLWNNGSMGYFSFNENGGTEAYDAFNRSFNFTFSNGVAWNSTQYKVGTSITCDGTNDRLNTNFDIGTTDKLTISAWVYPNNLSNSEITRAQGAARTAWVLDLNSSGNIGYTIDNGVGAVTFRSPKPIALRNWTHVVAIYNGTQVSIYLNGTFIGQSALTGNVYSTSLSESICYNVNGNNLFFNGTIDEIGFFNRTFTIQDVNDLYNAGSGRAWNDTYGITTLLSVPNGYAHLGGSTVNISVNNTVYRSDLNYTLRNISYYVWSNSGSLINKTVQSISGNLNTTNISLTGISGSTRYLWNAQSCYANNTDYGCSWGNGGNYSFYNYITLNIKDYNNVLINNSINIYCPSIGYNNSVSNPFITPLTTFTNGSSSASVSCTYIDSNYYNTPNTTTFNFNTSRTEYNISLSARQIVLYFQRYNGTSSNATGYYSDGNVTGNFTNSSFVAIQQNFMQGLVKVLFGFNSSIGNYTQFYEYDNDWVTDVSENITLLSGQTNLYTTTYIQVVDEQSGDSIDNALIRVSYSNPVTGGAYKLMGQRFTGSEGITGMSYFYLDTTTDVNLLVSADGYSAKTVTFDAGATSYGATNPLQVQLDRNASISKDGITISIPFIFGNRSEDVPAWIYAPLRSSISYTTDYRVSSGLGTVPVNLNSYKIGRWNITSGTDFATSGTSDIILYIYADGSLYGTYTIAYKTIDYSRFNRPTGLSESFSRMLLFMGLIFISGLFGFVFRRVGEEMGTGGISVNIFMIGGIAIGIFATGMGWLSLINGTYYAMLTIKRFIGD